MSRDKERSKKNRCKTCKKEKKEKEEKTEKTEKTEKKKNLEAKLLPFQVSPSLVLIRASSSVPDSIWATGAPVFWANGNMGEGVVVGIIDTGVDDSHPVLKGKLIARRDYVKDGRPTTSFNSHGTHVAGTVCADSFLLKGVAPKVQLRDYRVLDVNGSGSFDNVTKAIRDAADDGCHIINMSLGGPSPYDPLRAAIQYAVSKNVLVVCAAGNEGANRLSYPGSYPEVVSVGAVQFDRATGNLTLPSTPWFSNTNPQVDLCSDGWQVYSCIPGNKYATYSGTSMAAPATTGFAALLRNRLVKKLKRAPTENELYTVLRDSTVEANFSANLQGTGFVTVFPEIPKKLNNNWTIPSFLREAP